MKNLEILKKITGRAKRILKKSKAKVVRISKILIKNIVSIKFEDFHKITLPINIREILAITTLVISVLVIILSSASANGVGYLYFWSVYSFFSVSILYGSTISKNLLDILLYVPLRALVATLLVAGYALLIYNASQDFILNSISLTILAKTGIYIFGYMFVAPVVYKLFTKGLGLISIRVFGFRPYFERLVRGEIAAEYFLKPVDFALTSKFLARGIKGILVYPNEPLFNPAVRQIKKKLGSDILGLSLTDLEKMHKKKEFQKYFHLIELLRKEIKDPSSYSSMMPFVTLIKKDSVKEYDLGAVKSEQQLDQLILGIIKEKDYQNELVAEVLNPKTPWYDQNLKTLLTGNLLLFLVTVGVGLALEIMVFKAPWHVFAIYALLVIFVVDGIYASRMYFKQKDFQLAIVSEETSE